MNESNWPLFCFLAVAVGAALPPIGWLPVLSLLCLARLGSRGWTLFLLLLLSTWARTRLPEHALLDDARDLQADVVVTIMEPPVARPRGCRLTVEVHHWVNRAEGPGGQWIVEWNGPAEQVQLGDCWRFRGKLVGWPAPDYPGGWDGRRYWARRGASQRLWAWDAQFLRPAAPNSPLETLWSWRGRLTQRMVDRIPESGVLLAVVYGDESKLSPDVREQFRRAGVVHLLVASGANVAILTGWICLVGGWLGYAPHRCAGLALWLVPPYVVLTGGAPGMVRAGSMACFGLLARWTGHCTELGRTLLLASLAVLLWDPGYAFDLGFQLSFVAVASLAWLQPRCLPWLGWLSPRVREPFAAGLACSVGLAPVCWCTFHVLQPLALLANLWMAPLLELLLPTGLLWSLADLASPRFGSLLGGVFGPWLWFVQRSAEFWAQHSAQLLVPEPDWRGWCAWAVILTMLWWGPQLDSACLAIPLSWLLLCPGAPGRELEVRWLWLRGAPCVWILHGTRHQLLLLTTAEQRLDAETMRLRCGLPAFDRVVLRDEPVWRSLVWDGARVEVQPGCVRVFEDDLSLGFAVRAQDLQGMSWGLDSTGQWCWAGGRRRVLEKGRPWRLWRVGRQVWFAPWR